LPCIDNLQEKFGIEPTDTKAKEELIKSYLEGLAWVLTYYHDGESVEYSAE
jgi:5'-3' exonuclease